MAHLSGPSECSSVAVAAWCFSHDTPLLWLPARIEISSASELALLPVAKMARRGRGGPSDRGVVSCGVVAPEDMIQVAGAARDLASSTMRRCPDLT